MNDPEVCRKCGALVDPGSAHRHRRFHSDFDDIERDVSRLKDQVRQLEHELRTRR